MDSQLVFVPVSKSGVFRARIESVVVDPECGYDETLLASGRPVQPEPVLELSLHVAAGDHVGAVRCGSAAISPVHAETLRRVTLQRDRFSHARRYTRGAGTC